jgi:prepilin-type N-terminal cleavage/methylation domain-containing protein
MRVQRRHRGISLLECLVAILIVGIGMLASLQALYAGVRLSKKVQQIQQATLFAQYELELCRAAGGAGPGTVGKPLPPSTFFTDATSKQNLLVNNVAQTDAVNRLKTILPNATWQVDPEQYTDPNLATNHATLMSLEVVTAWVQWTDPSNHTVRVTLQTVMSGTVQPGTYTHLFY